MKILEFIKREALNWLLILLPFIYLIIVFDKMPPFTLSHLNIYWILFFIMGTGVFWYVKLLVQPYIVPRTSIHDNLKSVYRMKTIMLAYLSTLSLAFISKNAGISFNSDKLLFLVAMAFWIFLGNLYPTIRYNYFIGIRNSWTLSNEAIWKKTHLFAGRFYFWIGLAGAILEILINIPKQSMSYIILFGILTGFGLVRLYSYLLYRKIQLQNPARADL